MTTPTNERLQIECEKRGLPVSLDALLRHIDGNHAATLGAKDYSIEALRERVAKQEAELDQAWGEVQARGGWVPKAYRLRAGSAITGYQER